MTTKNIILLVVGVIAGIALWFWGWSCKGKSIIKTIGRDTTITVTKTDTVYKPGVTNTITNNFTKWYSVHDTLEIPGDLIVKIEHDDTAAILSDYYATRFYRDSQNLKRGSVIISDSVTQNRIVSRRLQTVNTDTTITVTTLLQPKGRIILYFGIDYLGYQKTPFFAAGADLTLKIPNDKLFTAGVLIDKDGKLIYQAGVKFPIRLGKRIIE